jgi:hypothetical protein
LYAAFCTSLASKIGRVITLTFLDDDDDDDDDDKYVSYCCQI